MWWGRSGWIRIASMVCLFYLLSCAFGFGRVVVDAHAGIEQSFPHDGAVLQQSPSIIRVTFNEQIAIETSQIVLQDATGAEVATQKEAVDERTLQLNVDPLTPGRYSVQWQVLSADTHVAEGQFSFSVQVPEERTQPSESVSLSPGRTKDNETKPPSPAIEQNNRTEPQRPITVAPMPPGERELGSMSLPQERVQRGDVPEHKTTVDSNEADKATTAKDPTSVSQQTNNFSQSMPKERDEARQVEMMSSPQDDPVLSEQKTTIPSETEGHGHHSGTPQQHSIEPLGWLTEGQEQLRFVVRFLKNVFLGLLLLVVLYPILWGRRSTVAVPTWIAWGLSGGAMLATWGQYVLIAISFAESAQGEAVSWGSVWWSIVVRDGLGLFALIETVLLLFGCAWMYAPRRDRTFAQYGHALIVIAVVWVASLSTHPATLTDVFWAQWARTAHVVAGACWAGSVVWWMMATWWRQGTESVERYRRIAIVSGLGVVVTSALMSGAVLPSWESVMTTPYGTLLWSKVLLTVILATIGIVQTTLRQRHWIWGQCEIVMVIALVVVATGLGMTPPAA